MVDITPHLKRVQTVKAGRTQADALHELMAYGLEIKNFIDNGEVQRVRDTQKPGANDNGWYVVHEMDGIYYGAYGSWSRGESHKFCSVAVNTLTPEQSMAIKRRQKDAQERAERLRDAAAQRAEEIIENSPAADPNHPYLVRKRVKPHDINQSGNELLIPVMNILGEIRTYQRIPPVGDKKFMKDGEAKGNFFRIGIPGEKIFIATGYATGATVFELSGKCVYIAFNDGNLRAVAEAVRKLHPDSDIVIVADNDQWGTKNGQPYNSGLDHANKASQSVSGCSFIYPSFKDLSSKPSDFNDLFLLEGRDITLSQLGEYVAKIQAKPIGRIDLTIMPKREFLYGAHLIRKYCSATLSPGGIGKTQLVMTDAIAIAAGKTLLHDEVYEQARTWHYNLEDPMDELMRRAAAICRYHDVDMDLIENDFFLNSGREQKLIVLEKTKNGEYARPHADELYHAIRDNGISVLSIDPFVKVHYADENSNKDIDEVASIFAQIANDTGCCIDLVHHTKKPLGKGDSHAGNIDSARGASALAGAVRAARTLTGMTAEEAEAFGIPERRSWFLRIDNAKANMSAPADKTSWLERQSVELPNGDHVGAIDTWQPPKLFNQITASQVEQIMAELKANFYSPDNRGGESAVQLIASVTRLNETQCANIFKTWVKNGLVFKQKDMHPERRENRMRVFPKV